VWLRCPSTVTIATSTAKIEIANEMLVNDSSPPSFTCFENS